MSPSWRVSSAQDWIAQHSRDRWYIVDSSREFGERKHPLRNHLLYLVMLGAFLAVLLGATPVAAQQTPPPNATPATTTSPTTTLPAQLPRAGDLPSAAPLVASMGLALVGAGIGIKRRRQ
jgi:hypothetical protein